MGRDREPAEPAANPLFPIDAASLPCILLLETLSVLPRSLIGRLNQYLLVGALDDSSTWRSRDNSWANDWRPGTTLILSGSQCTVIGLAT